MSFREFDTFENYGTIEANWFAQLLDHALDKSADYHIRKKDTVFQILHGSGSNQAGKVYDQNTDFESLFQDFLDSIGYAQVVRFKGNIITPGFPPTGHITVSTGFTIPSTADGLELYFPETFGLGYVPLEKGWIFKAQANVPLFTVDGKTKFHGLRAVKGTSQFSYGVLGNTAVKVENSIFRQVDTAIDLKGDYSDAILNRCNACTTAILKEGSYQHLFFNRMFSNTYGMDIREAGFDTIEGNYIQGGTYGLKIDTLDSSMCYVVVVGGKIHDCDVGVYINDADAKFSIVGTKMEHHDTYHVQVVNSTYAMLMGLPLEVDDEVAIRTEGGKTILSGICCEIIGTGSSYSTSGSPTVIQRGCYSSDGLLEAL